MPPAPKTSRALLAVAALTVASAAALFVVGMSDLRRGSDPPPVEPTSAPLGPLTRHLVLVVVDGLRYDFAVDPGRAPHFARRMREEAHARVWAGRVTMTSSSVLAIGTGQRGEFAQVVFNLNASRVRHNDVVGNARAAGLRTALAGDEVWAQAFGDFDAQVLDEHGISLETDNSPEILAAGARLAASPPRPALLVVHLLAPDHQAHAYRADSDRYRAHLRRLDEGIAALVDGLPPDTTVIALSDHGALPDGQHGVDSREERLTPLWAIGPGIRPGVDAGDLDQVDLGPTVATLLGVPGPAHGRGSPATSLMDLSPRDAARVACADASRVLRLVATDGAPDFAATARGLARTCDDPAAPAEDARQASVAVARAWDAHVQRSAATAGTRAMTAAGALLVGLFAVAAGALARTGTGLGALGAGRIVLCAAVVSAASVALTWVVDHAPPPINDVRAWIVAAAQFPLYLAIVRPSAAARMYAAAPVALGAVMPGVLAWSFPMNARVHSFVSLVAGTALWILLPHADVVERGTIGRAKPALGRAAMAAAAAGLVALGPYALGPENDPVGAWAARPGTMLGAGMAMTVLWLASFARTRDPGGRLLDVGVAIAVAAGGVLGRPVLPAAVGIGALVGLPVLAVVAARRGRATIAAGAAFGAYGLVSRPEEVLAIAGAALVAEAIGSSAGAPAPAGAPPLERRPFAVATLLLLLFAVSFLARVGVQRGLDFTSIDWGAGGFGDPSASQLRIGLCIGAKYVLAAVLVVWLFVRPLPRTIGTALVAVSALLWFGRAATLEMTLFAFGPSAFWTALRAISDIPSAIILAVCCSALLAARMVRPACEPAVTSGEARLAA